MYNPRKIAFIGAGAMGSAIIGGVLNAGKTDSRRIVAADPDPKRREALAEAYGIETVADNEYAVKLADLVFICVKPQIIQDLLSELADYKELQDKVFVSVAAGTPMSAFKQFIPGIRLIRVMPNNPCMIGRGAAALAAGGNVDGESVAYVMDLMKSIGICRQVKEELFDAVTGLSGSGPAYVYIFIDALADAGVAQGLTRADALALAAQTVMGAAMMQIETGQNPMTLKEQVASPGGTTIHGVESLEQNAFRGAVFAAVRAAAERSRELMSIYGA